MHHPTPRTLHQTRCTGCGVSGGASEYGRRMRSTSSWRKQAPSCGIMHAGMMAAKTHNRTPALPTMRLVSCAGLAPSSLNLGPLCTMTTTLASAPPLSHRRDLLHRLRHCHPALLQPQLPQVCLPEIAAQYPGLHSELQPPCLPRSPSQPQALRNAPAATAAMAALHSFLSPSSSCRCLPVVHSPSHQHQVQAWLPAPARR